MTIIQAVEFLLERGLTPEEYTLLFTNRKRSILGGYDLSETDAALMLKLELDNKVQGTNPEEKI